MILTTKQYYKKLYDDLFLLTQSLQDRIHRIDNELGFDSKEKKNVDSMFRGFDVLFKQQYVGFTEKTIPSLKEKIEMIEKHLGGKVKEIESKKEIKFVKNKTISKKK